MIILTESEIRRIISRKMKKDQFLINELKQGDTMTIGKKAKGKGFAVTVVGPMKGATSSKFVYVYLPFKGAKLRKITRSVPGVFGNISDKSIDWLYSKESGPVLPGKKFGRWSKEKFKELVNQGRILAIINPDKIDEIEDITFDDFIQNKTFRNVAGYSLLGIGLVADFLPGPGTAVSVATGIAGIMLALSKKPNPNYFGAGLSLVSFVPVVGDVIGISGKIIRNTIEAGKKVPLSLLQRIAKGLLKINEKKLKSVVTQWASDESIKLADAKRKLILKSIPKMFAALTKFKKEILFLIKKAKSQSS